MDKPNKQETKTVKAIVKKPASKKAPVKKAGSKNIATTKKAGSKNIATTKKAGFKSMTFQTMLELKTKHPPKKCPICGADSMVVIGKDTMVITCCGPKCTDGGPTYCGAQLDGVLTPDAYMIQLNRWNKKHK